MNATLATRKVASSDMPPSVLAIEYYIGHAVVHKGISVGTFS